VVVVALTVVVVVVALVVLVVLCRLRSDDDNAREVALVVVVVVRGTAVVVVDFQRVVANARRPEVAPTRASSATTMIAIGASVSTRRFLEYEPRIRVAAAFPLDVVLAFAATLRRWRALLVGSTKSPRGLRSGPAFCPGASTIRPMAGRRARTGKWKPVLGLFFLAPVVAELVGSGNVPTILFLNPAIFLLFALLYGPPALVLRELLVRGRIGWPGALLFGFAFGALDEGIVADSWFKPRALHMTASQLGRVGHVNWNLVANLTVFHTFVSMFVSIALAELIFRDFAYQPWLRKRGIFFCAAISLFVAVGDLSTRAHGKPRIVPDHPQRVATLWVIFAVIAVALVLPRWRIPVSQHNVPRPQRVFAIGFVWFATYLFTFFGLTKLAPPLVPIVALALWTSAVVAVLWWAGSTHWTARHTLLLCAGVLAPSMVLTSWRIVVLQPVSSALFVWLLVRLDRRLRAPSPG
jgi:hypothetical protein